MEKTRCENQPPPRLAQFWAGHGRKWAGKADEGLPPRRWTSKLGTGRKIVKFNGGVAKYFQIFKTGRTKEDVQESPSAAAVEESDDFVAGESQQ